MYRDLRLFLAAIVAGFALIGLTFAVDILPAALVTVLLIVGTIIVIGFALVIVFLALKALFGKRYKEY